MPTPGAGLNGITVGLDGALWFTEGMRRRRRADQPRGEIVEIPLGEGASPTGITTGADGAIWFSAQGTNRVGRLEPSAAPETPRRDRPGRHHRLAGRRLGADRRRGDGRRLLLHGRGRAARAWPPATDRSRTARSCRTVSARTRSRSRARTWRATSATATHAYVVFEDISGPITNQSRLQGRTRDPDHPRARCARPEGPVLRERVPAGARRWTARPAEATGPDAAGERPDEPLEQTGD